MSAPHCKQCFLHLEDLSKNPSSSFAESSRGNTTWHTLLSAPTTPTDALSAGIAVCPSNGSLALHRHKQAEIYYVLSGSGEVEIDGARQRVSKNMIIWIPGDAEHGVFCGDGEELKWLYIFPESKFEDIVYRFSNEEQSQPRRTSKL
ncbi:RmlC-like cupin domain-containing protein [Macrophomina phaseolina]|uniref:RmlC-like cupin domain-containing protein n=1 Tax=Macrophomina phaseolina TaxID=35725 RepID=A0ABQ8G143_9PEZI|nr:RmlC-like cupin domain-containing protein [Macrophomina phaseolina]